MLIIIEGLPGSGKTATAQHLHHHLTSQDQPARVFFEGSPDNPVGFIWSNQTAEKSILSTTFANYPFHSWKGLGREDHVILESRLLQNTSLYWMLRGGEESRCREFPQKIWEQFARGEIKLIFLDHCDNPHHLNRIMAERQASHPQWMDFVAPLFARLPWNQQRGLSGPEGFVEAMLHWGTIQQDIFAELEGDKLRIVDGERDWEETLNRIFQFVEA